MSIPSILITIVVGAVAGYLASLIMGTKGGLLRYIILGVIGGVVGGFVFGLLNISIGLPLHLDEVLVGFVGACIVVFLFNLLFK